MSGRDHLGLDPVWKQSVGREGLLVIITDHERWTGGSGDGGCGVDVKVSDVIAWINVM